MAIASRIVIKSSRVSRGPSLRCFRVSSGDGEVNELIDKEIVSPREVSAAEVERKLVTTKKEALDLYRLILRHTRLFLWRNDQGEFWRDVLRSSARKEFEVARFERDPERIARMLVGGRDAVHAIVDKFMKKREDIRKKDFG